MIGTDSAVQCISCTGWTAKRNGSLPPSKRPGSFNASLRTIAPRGAQLPDLRTFQGAPDPRRVASCLGRFVYPLLSGVGAELFGDV